MKPKLLLNLVLAVIWGAVNGSLAPSTLIVGFIFGYLIILLFEPLLGGGERYGFRFFYWIRFFFWFIKELVSSSIRVAVDVLSPSMKRIIPGVIAIPLDLNTEAEITLMANLISLTPGTLSIDVSPDLKTLYIHDMYIANGDVEAEVTSIKASVERRVQIAMGSKERREREGGHEELRAHHEAP